MPRHPTSAGLVALALAAAPACGDGEAERRPLAIDPGCQPLLASTSRDEVSRAACLLPYPSDCHLAEAPETATGRRVVLAPAARPRVAATGEEADPHVALSIDGASTAASIVATLPSEIVGDGLPGVLDDPRASARPESATILLDVEAGALVPHYVDVHDRAADERHKPIVMRAFSPLRPRARYVAALAGVRLADGRTAPAAEGFRRLRDRQGGDPALDALAARFEADVLAPLARAGVARERLQLAWDFTTGSAEAPTSDMRRVRELTLAWLGAAPPEVRVTEVQDGDDRLWRVVRGTVTAPLFLDQPGPGARLFRDGGGRVTQNGTTTFEFVVHVPVSVRDAFEPGRSLAYGHGFFGGKTELDGDGARTIADRLRAVEIGIDWWGMTRDDIGVLAEAMAARPARVADFTERVHQAMANWIVMIAAVRGPLTAAPELHRPASGPGVVAGPGGTTNAGALVYDPSFVGYFGASQGHILGGTLAALEPTVDRFVLNVGGGGFTHLMPRSGNFGPLAILLEGALQDPLFVQAFVAMMAPGLDRIDPVIYAPLVAREPLPGGPADRRVLLQVGLGDPAVPNVGSFLHARALGVKQTTPAPLDVFGLEPTPGGEPVSGLTVFDYGIDTRGSALPAPLPQNEVHEGLRVNAAAIRQMDAFLRPGGVVVHPCDGPCDPE